MAEEVKELKEDDKKAETKEDDSKSATLADVKQIVNDAVEGLKDLVTGKGKEGEPKKEDDKEPSDDDKRPRGRSFRDVEAFAESAVAKAAEKLFKEKEHEAEHASLKKPETKEPETPPNKVPWLQKVLWGSGE